MHGPSQTPVTEWSKISEWIGDTSSSKACYSPLWWQEILSRPQHFDLYPNTTTLFSRTIASAINFPGDQIIFVHTYR